MSRRLIDALHTVAPEVTAQELADAVWLLARVSEHSGAPGRTVDAGHHEPPVRPASGDPLEYLPTQPDEPAHARPPVDVEARGPAVEGRTRHAEWHVPAPDRLIDEAGWEPVRSPGAAALPATLALARSLRPLRRRMPSRTGRLLDEEATVRLAVDSELLMPVWRPALDRWLDLALVVDESDSMAIWRQTGAELRDLLERLGAFRDVRVWHCDTDLRGGPLALRAEAAPEGAVRRAPAELLDPTGRRAVLVLSDCIGQAWGNGAMAAALHAWGSAGPVSIIQPLPQRLWDGCAPTFHPVRLNASRPAASNAELQVRSSDFGLAGSDGAGRGVPVPVVELEARWFAPWASLVAATGPDWVPGTVLFTRAEIEPVASSSVPHRDSDPLESFFGLASTEATRLAVCLSAAPLNLPVMRLVQRVMLPESRPSVLAEVFLGGLLRQRSRRLERRISPDDIEYDFAPGIRDRLLGALSRPDTLTVLAKVSDYISTRLGSPIDFRALLAAEDSAAGLLQRDPPFAQVALQVLQSLDGRYREAAERLAQRTRIALPTAGVQHALTVEGSWSANGGTGPEFDASGTFSSQPVQPDPDHGPARLIPDGWVPLPDPHFTGRSELLELLHHELVSRAVPVALLPDPLYGLGGVGSSQLAVEYVHRNQSRYDLVWWLPAESPTLVRASLAALAQEMGLPAGLDVSQTVTGVLEALRAERPYRRWLLVFDGAGHPEEIRAYLPLPAGHILITSRDARWAEVAATVEVGAFTRAESMALLRSRSRGICDADADLLADKLGDLPIAVHLAAAWLAETRGAAGDLLGLIDDRIERLLAGTPVWYPATPVAAICGLAVEWLAGNAPGAAELLELCAFFGSQPISVAMLRDGRHADLPEPMSLVLRDEIQLSRAIRSIGRLALARIDPRGDRIEVHQLVAATLRELLSPARRDAIRDQVHAVMAAACPPDPDHPRHWERHRAFQGHLTASDLVSAATAEARRVALDQIRYRFVRGDYERSRHLGEAVVQRWRDVLGPDHEQTLLAQRHLADALRAVGERTSAHALNQQTLDRMRDVFGADHEHTLTTARSLGIDLRLAGRFDLARDHDAQNLERHRRVFGDDDPNTLRAMNDLASDLRLLGDHVGALNLDSVAWAGYERWFGPTDARTFAAACSVAQDQFDVGDFHASSRLLDGRLSEVRPHLGEGDARTLAAMRLHAITLRHLGSYERARRLAHAAHQRMPVLSRPGHEDALSATVTFANALREAGELAHARMLAEQALHGYQEGFGAEHPFTLVAAVNLAVVLRATDELVDATLLDEKSLSALREALGGGHPYTVAAMLNLAGDRAAMHDNRRACELSAEAYAAAVATRGEEHPRTLACALNHALDLRTMGEHRGETLLQATRRRYLTRYGPDFPAARAAVDGRRIELDLELPSISAG